MRVAQDPEFRYIVEDTERLKNKSAEKTVSLNEAQRLTEKLVTEHREELRKQARTVRHIEPLKMTEITLASLTGGTNTVAAITRKVLDDSAKNSKADGAKKPATGENEVPAPDTNFDEGVNILADLVQLLGNQNAKN